MVCAFFLVSASVQGCVVHMVAMLTDRGITVQTAALGSSLLGAAVLIGRVGTGFLLDRLFAPYLAAVLFGGYAVGIGLLWISRAQAMALVGAFLVGLGLGAELDIIAYLVSRYFGLRAFWGDLWFCHQRLPGGRRVGSSDDGCWLRSNGLLSRTARGPSLRSLS
jgi:hypothetical protein